MCEKHAYTELKPREEDQMINLSRPQASSALTLLPVFQDCGSREVFITVFAHRLGKKISFGVKSMPSTVSTFRRFISDWTHGAGSTFDDLLSQRRVLSTGISQLDQALSGGFPQGRLIELYPQRTGRSEVGILLGALAQCKRVVWVLNPEHPMIPYQEGLKSAGLDLSRQLFAVPATPRDAFWSVEQALLSGECDAIVAWLPPLSAREDFRAMARLQLAAAQGRVTLFVIRPFVMSGVSSPAFMRVQLYVGSRPEELRARITTDDYIWSRPAEVSFSLAFSRMAISADMQPANRRKSFGKVRPAMAS